VRLSQLRFIVGVLFALSAMVVLIAFRHASLGAILAVTLAYLSTLMVSIAILLEYPRLNRQPPRSKLARELERRNLLFSTRYCAERAFRVEALHDEGPHYFLQLDSGAVLHLGGAYLCEYEPRDGGAVRHFPCTQFTVRRHTQTGQAVDLICDGIIIEPELEAPAYTARDFAEDRVPADGEIMRNISFDALRQQRLNPPVDYTDVRTS
jgi:hypothetical protein